MAAPSQSKAEVREHADAIEQAAEFFRAMAKRGALPLTPAEFEERVNQFYSSLEAKLGTSNALLLAVLNDQPCPQSLFAPWAGPKAIWQWRNAKRNPLPAVTRNGKVCIKPSDFFRALEVHGEANQ